MTLRRNVLQQLSPPDAHVGPGAGTPAPLATRVPCPVRVWGGGWDSPVGRREFVPVHLTGSPAQGYRAEPTSEPGRTSLLGLAWANAIAVVPEDTGLVAAGSSLHCLLLES